ncbi:ATP-binding protein [Bacillus sp. EAC]|uniref:ATP-binding protein n=1 Tax=Bacillus sp. EAC TaxID=1978338 RepID=UPI00211B2A50|nr:ATP-binding protein [Bacillus sp. EAC]
MKKISFQGGMASGKTTLIKRIENRLRDKDIIFTYENPFPVVEKRKKLNIDIHTEEGFLANQRLFIENEIDRFNQLPDCKVIFDRGPEDIEFYTIHFPIANGVNWHIESDLEQELIKLRKCRSDLIIYLDASEETLRKRMLNDKNRSRNSFEQNMKLYQFEREWFSQFNTTFVNVDKRTPVEMEDWMIKFFKEHNFL